MKESRLRSSVRAFRHRNYRLFFSGQLISVIGTWMQSVAQSWLVYRLTGSPALLGAVGFASQIPVLVLAPFGGAVADRFPRHRVLVATQTSAMLLAFPLAALTLTHRIHVWHIVLFAALLGVVNAFDIPARQAFVVEMVGREDLTNAIALNSSMMNGARIVGPAVAGVVVAAVGEGWCFLGNAISYAAVIIGLLLMNVVRTNPVRNGSHFQAIIEGFRYVNQTRPIRALLILLGVVSLAGMPYAVLMPIFADQILHGGPKALGLLMGFSGVGALMGALLLAGRRGVRGLGQWIVVATAGFGISLVLFSRSENLWLSAAMLLPVGFSMMVQMAASNTLIQSMSPDHIRGRVMAVYSMMFMGMAPIGALLSGFLANHIGAPWTVGAGGAVCIAAGAAFRSRLPSLRTEARQLILAQTMSAGTPAETETGERVAS